MQFDGLELPPEVRATLDAEVVVEPATLPNVLRRGVERWGNEELVVHDGVTTTWSDLDQDSARLAKGLLAIGATKGSRIGLLMPNSADWLRAFVAATRIGAVVSPLSTFLQGPELGRALAAADIQILLCVDRFLTHDYAARLEQIPGLTAQPGSDLYLPDHPHLRHIVMWGQAKRPWAIAGPDGLAHLAASRPRIDDALLGAAEASVSPADWFLTVWTSGTTAEPKGVVHTHGGVFRYCHGLRAMGRADVRRGERSYSGMPFFWLGGLNGQVIPALLCGAVIVTTDEVRPDRVLAMLVEQRVARVTSWLRPLTDLRRTAVELGIDVSGIRGLATLAYPDGSAVPPDRVGNAFGMTETFGPVAAEAPAAILPPEKAGAMGRVVSGYEREIVDPVEGTPLPAGTIGELRVRGPGLMVGYYKRERSETFDADGFFRTGDRCSIDEDGFLFFHGRENEVIKTSGANVSPVEIEHLLTSLPDVSEAFVFGIPDPDRDEAIAAVLVPSPDAHLDPGAIRRRLQAEVSNFKVPHHFLVLANDEIPRTESGKARKHVIARTHFAAAFAGPDDTGVSDPNR